MGKSDTSVDGETSSMSQSSKNDEFKVFKHSSTQCTNYLLSTDRLYQKKMRSYVLKRQQILTIF